MNARNGIHRRLNARLDLEHGAPPFAPRLEHHAAETAVGESELEGVAGLRNLFKITVHDFRVERSLLDGRVRRAFHDAEDDALVFHRREFVRGHEIHRDGEQAQKNPHDVNRRPARNRLVEHAAVKIFQPVEIAVDAAGQTVFLAVVT